MKQETNPNSGAFATSDEHYEQVGLTKREYFAAMAMQGILSNQMLMDSSISLMLEGKTKDLGSHICGMSVEYSDALIKALNE